MKTNILFLLLVVLALGACKNTTDKSEKADPTQKKGSLNIASEVFGEAPAGTAHLYTLKNKNGMVVKITNFGGIIQSILVPDKNGEWNDVVLGFDKLEDYINKHPYFGAIIGRYGNRIAKGKFSIDGEDYTLALNNGPNSLHGGVKGFDKKLWQAKEVKKEDAVGLELSRLSVDFEEGYPGNLEVKITYWLNNRNEILMEYEATTDKKTVCNLTNHSYFNLAGAGSGDILGHELMIKAAHLTPVDETLIPTGELMPVEGTPFDFSTPTAIGARIEEDHDQLKFGGGYDHNFALKREGKGMELVASVFEAGSGRLLEVLTEEPGLQFYCGNFLDGSHIGKGGKVYNYRTGFCLETQHFPDSPNQENFPSTILEPGQVYKTKTVYRFSSK